MKNNLRINIIGSLVVMIITFLMVQYMGHLLDPKWTESAMDAIRAFHLLEENSVDVIIYGSSHALKGCEVMEMYKNYDIAAYNYGNNWQKLNTTLLFLQDSLKTQTPKVVCIETRFAGTVLEDTDLTGEIYYTRPIKNFEGKKAYLKKCFGTDLVRYFEYYVPLTMFHENWNVVEEENFNRPNPQLYLRSMGYRGTTKVRPVTLGDYKQFEQKSLPDKSKEILDQMVQCCNEKGIKIIFYTVPYEGTYKYIDSMTHYAMENGCEYINLFAHIEELGMDSGTDFRDIDHLNDSGSKKVANFLGKYIKEHYNIPDARKIKGNLWEQNLSK